MAHPKTWRVAKSLLTLKSQIDGVAPARGKKMDGTIGDAAHANRKSDHNPNPEGVVTAIDFTHDPADGLDCQVLADRLVASQDPRIKYIIWKGRIISSKVNPWVWRVYKGHPHASHLHLSVGPGADRYDDDAPWNLLGRR